MEKFKEYSGVILFYTLLIILLGGWAPLSEGYKYYFTEQCSIETISSSSLQAIENNVGEKETNTENLGGQTQKEMKEKGSDGKKRICRKAGKVLSEVTISKPTPDKYEVYTYKYKPYTPPRSYQPYTSPSYDNYGPSALCRDGTYSYSTGRGTCSWHGGVAQWL